MQGNHFRLRSDVQGRQLEETVGLSAEQVEELLMTQIRQWLGAPSTLLHLTCGDARFTIVASEQLPAPPARSGAQAAPDESADLVSVQSEESFPASDPPSSTGTATGPGKR